jgi:hypothetical protein
MKRSPKIKEIVANRIVLKSPKGKIRIVLDASSEDAAFLQLYGSHVPSLLMCIDSDGNPKVCLWNKHDRVGISIGISDDTGHGITLHDSAGRPVCFITVAEDGIPRIKMFEVTSSAEGKKIWETPTPKKTRKKRNPEGQRRRTS